MSNIGFYDIQYKANAGQVNLDQAQGIVECFVAGIGNKDSVGDVCASGAFTKSLMRRKPRVVWGHNWNDPIGKVMEIYEVPPNDPRLPGKMKAAGIGGLYARVQFNLNSEKGREAFANVAFFGEEQEWSIGYKTIKAQFDQQNQANILYEVELYEVSPVLHGANQLTGTISVKDAEKGGTAVIPMPANPMDMPEEDIQRKLQDQLSAQLGGKVKVSAISDGHVMFSREGDEGNMYKCRFHHEDGAFMFGQPQRIVMPMPQAPKPQQMPQMPMGMPSKPIQPAQTGQTVVVPAALPGGNPQQQPLVRISYTGEDSNEKPAGKPKLVQEEADLANALLQVVKRHGKFNEDSTGVWAGYKKAEENPVAKIGVKCSNCVMYEGEGNCKIIAMDVDPGGKCRFAIIPEGVVKTTPIKKQEVNAEKEQEEVKWLTDIEAKFPEEFLNGELRMALKRKREASTESVKMAHISEFESKSLDSNTYFYVPVDPEHAFEMKQAIDPIIDYYRADAHVEDGGIVFTSGVNKDFAEAIDTAVKALGRNLAGKLRSGGRGLSARFNPNAWDGDNDGIVQEGTPYQRPAIPGVNDFSTRGKVDKRKARQAWEKYQQDGKPATQKKPISQAPKPSAPKPTRGEDMPSAAPRPGASSASKRSLTRHSNRDAKYEAQFPDRNENAKRESHEALIQAWEKGMGMPFTPIERQVGEKGARFTEDWLRGRELGYNDAKARWMGKGTSKRPSTFKDNQKSSVDYANWFMNVVGQLGRDKRDRDNRDPQNGYDNEGIEAGIKTFLMENTPTPESRELQDAIAKTMKDAGFERGRGLSSGKKPTGEDDSTSRLSPQERADLEARRDNEEQSARDMDRGLSSGKLFIGTERELEGARRKKARTLDESELEQGGEFVTEGYPLNYRGTGIGTNDPQDLEEITYSDDGENSVASPKKFVGNTVAFADGRRGVITSSLREPNAQYEESYDEDQGYGSRVSFTPGEAEIMITHDKNGKLLDTPERFVGTFSMTEENSVQTSDYLDPDYPNNFAIEDNKVSKDTIDDLKSVGGSRRGLSSGRGARGRRLSPRESYLQDRKIQEEEKQNFGNLFDEINKRLTDAGLSPYSSSNLDGPRFRSNAVQNLMRTAKDVEPKLNSIRRNFEDLSAGGERRKEALRRIFAKNATDDVLTETLRRRHENLMSDDYNVDDGETRWDEDKFEDWSAYLNEPGWDPFREEVLQAVADELGLDVESDEVTDAFYELDPEDYANLIPLDALIDVYGEQEAEKRKRKLAMYNMANELNLPFKENIVLSGSARNRVEEISRGLSSGRRWDERGIDYRQGDPETVGRDMERLSQRSDDLGANFRHLLRNVPEGDSVVFEYRGKLRQVTPEWAGRGSASMKTSSDGAVYFGGIDSETGEFRTFRLDRINGLIQGAEYGDYDSGWDGSGFNDPLPRALGGLSSGRRGYGSRGPYSSRGEYDPNLDPYFDQDEPDYEAVNDFEWDEIPADVASEITKDIEEYILNRDKSEPDNVARVIDKDGNLGISDETTIIEQDGVKYVANPVTSDKEVIEKFVNNDDTKINRYYGSQNNTYNKKELIDSIEEWRSRADQSLDDGFITKEELDSINKEFEKIKSLIDNPSDNSIKELNASNQNISNIIRSAKERADNARRSGDITEDQYTALFDSYRWFDMGRSGSTFPGRSGDGPSFRRMMDTLDENRYKGKVSDDGKYEITPLNEYAKDVINGGELEYEVDGDNEVGSYTRVSDPAYIWTEFDKFSNDSGLSSGRRGVSSGATKIDINKPNTIVDAVVEAFGGEYGDFDWRNLRSKRKFMSDEEIGREQLDKLKRAIEVRNEILSQYGIDSKYRGTNALDEIDPETTDERAMDYIDQLDQFISDASRPFYDSYDDGRRAKSNASDLRNRLYDTEAEIRQLVQEKLTLENDFNDREIDEDGDLIITPDYFEGKMYELNKEEESLRDEYRLIDSQLEQEDALVRDYAILGDLLDEAELLYRSRKGSTPREQRRAGLSSGRRDLTDDDIEARNEFMREGMLDQVQREEDDFARAFAGESSLDRAKIAVAYRRETGRSANPKDSRFRQFAEEMLDAKRRSDEGRFDTARDQARGLSSGSRNSERINRVADRMFDDYLGSGSDLENASPDELADRYGVSPSVATRAKREAQEFLDQVDRDMEDWVRNQPEPTDEELQAQADDYSRRYPQDGLSSGRNRKKG